jgi:hypothetical protein
MGIGVHRIDDIFPDLESQRIDLDVLFGQAFVHIFLTDSMTLLPESYIQHKEVFATGQAEQYIKKGYQVYQAYQEYQKSSCTPVVDTLGTRVSNAVQYTHAY